MIFDGLVQWYRNRCVGNAIKNGNLEVLAAVLDQGVDLSRFSGEVEEETYEILTYSRDINSVLEWALEHHLPPEGFEMLLQAGAPLDDKVFERVSQQAQDPKQFPVAERTLAILEAHGINRSSPTIEQHLTARRVRL